MDAIEIEDKSPKIAMYYFIPGGILVILGIVLLFDIIRNIYGNIEESI